MKVHILGSSSAGNCYIFEAKDAILIIELGIAFKDVKKALNFDFSKVVGALVTHEHGDHASAVKDAVKMGIKIHASEGTLEAIGNDNKFMIPIGSEQAFSIGPFNIIPFDVIHNANEPFGFIINHEECGNVLFITDSSYLDYQFNNIHNIFIEANYCEEILFNRAGVHPAQALRVRRDHMSIQSCRQMLKENDLSLVNNIVLTHLSDGNSDEKRFVKDVYEQTGKTVYAAKKGMILEINQSPF